MTPVPALDLVPSFGPPAPAGLLGRGWTYDTAATAAALAAGGEPGRAGALLAQLAALQAPDGGLAQSYDLATGAGDGPPRSGVMAWVGLAAVAAGRHDALLDGVLRWLAARREDWHGLFRGGADVRWASAEHNLEVRALLAALGEPVAALDAAIDRHLLVRDGPAAVRQGFEDDVRPSDAQALGILWLCALGRDAEARAVAATAEATLRVRDRRVAWPGAESLAFTGYRPFAGGWAPDVLWMEGTLQLRLARARLGEADDELDAAIAAWAALTPGAMLLQADREAGDLHVWPAAAPAAWLRLVRSGFPLL